MHSEQRGLPAGRGRPIRVLEAIRQGNVGGGESHLLSLVANLDYVQYQPIVLSFTEGPMVDRIKQMHIPVYVIRSGKAFDLRVIRRVKELLRSQEVDLIHAHGSRAAANLIWAARSLHIPIIYTIHGWSFHEDQSAAMRWLRIRSEAYLTSRMDANISVSVSNQETGIKYIRGFRSEVITNGIDLDKFNPDLLFRDIRPEWGIPPGNTLVTAISRITAQKDPLNLVRGFGQACEKDSGISLLIVGEGELKEATIQLVKELGLKKWVIFQDFRQDIPDILHFTDIYCLPSLWEGLPIGLLEAMAMGKATIASAVDGTREIIRHGENGWLIEPGNPGQLAAAILALHRDPAVRLKLGTNARTTISHGFSAKAMTGQVEKVYHRILNPEINQ
ncbi:MAG TPA: glycosyltransferase [Chitinophagaceae bacterium]|nr:glycosyltransferase [Chitinophagaceae bacterium]